VEGGVIMENEEIKKPEYTPEMTLGEKMKLAKEYMIKIAEKKAKEKNQG